VIGTCRLDAAPEKNVAAAAAAEAAEIGIEAAQAEEADRVKVF
jgi:hypothetical protein